LIATWCRDGTLAEPLELAVRLAMSLGLEPTGSSLVCVPIADPEPVRAALEAAGIRAAVRGDAIRFSLHVWNDAADVDRAVEAIRPLLVG
jgi:selenocysteine lyase/cysteine desulfurase